MLIQKGHKFRVDDFVRRDIRLGILMRVNILSYVAIAAIFHKKGETI